MGAGVIEVIFDQPSQSYAIGEIVTGRAEVRVERDLECRRLLLTRGWRTSGAGIQASGGREELVLFSGAWQPNHDYVYPFQFPAPAGPLTYRGRLLNVHWMVAAQADVSFGLDLRVEEEIQVVGRSPAPHGDGALPFQTDFGTPPSAPISGQMGGVGLSTPAMSMPLAAVIAALGIFLLIGGPRLVFGSDTVFWSGGTFTIVGLIFAVLGGLSLYRAVRNPLAQRTLGPVTADLSPRVVRRGEQIACNLSFQPRTSMQMTGITAALVLREVTMRRRRNQKRAVTQEAFREAMTLAQGRTLQPGEPIDVRATIPVPADGACTFRAPDNSLNWTVEVRIGVGGKPDWASEYAIDVHP
jgi:hypothetical protein